MPVYVGVDCGGTSTRLLAKNEHGDTVFEAKSGAANWKSTPRQVLSDHLKQVFCVAPPADSVCVAMAGILSEDDKVQAAELIRSLGIHCPVIVVPDYLAPLALIPDGEVCFISGTGSCMVVQIGSQVYKFGAGGTLLGDSGSGFELGRLTLQTALTMPNGWANAGENLKLLLVEKLGELSQAEYVSAIYTAKSPTAEIAGFARATIADYEAGNPAAKRALDTVVENIFDQLVSLCEYLNADKLVVHLTGSIWKISPLPMELLNKKAVVSRPPIELRLMEREPVEGAVILAKRAIE